MPWLWPQLPSWRDGDISWEGRAGLPVAYLVLHLHHLRCRPGKFPLLLLWGTSLLRQVDTKCPLVFSPYICSNQGLFRKNGHPKVCRLWRAHLLWGVCQGWEPDLAHGALRLLDLRRQAGRQQVRNAWPGSACLCQLLVSLHQEDVCCLWPWHQVILLIEIQMLFPPGEGDLPCNGSWMGVKDCVYKQGPVDLQIWTFRDQTS